VVKKLCNINNNITKHHFLKVGLLPSRPLGYKYNTVKVVANYFLSLYSRIEQIFFFVVNCIYLIKFNHDG